METTVKSNHTKTSAQTAKVNVASKSLFWNKLEYNRYGIISMLVILIGCVGGIAAAFGAGADTIKLSMIAFPTIISLALVLAVAPMRAIVFASSIALFLDLVVLFVL